MTKDGLRRLATATAAAAGLAAAWGGSALAGDGSVRPPNYVFPDGLKGFELESDRLINPCFLIGFGPLGPGDNLSVDLTNPLAPVVTNTHAGGVFALEFSVDDHVGSGLITLPAAPNADGRTSFRTLFDGHLIEVDMQTGPGSVDPASWVAFNPTPEPPGDFFAVNFQYANANDPFVRFTASVDGRPVVFAVPEPGTWSMTILGLGLVGGAMRRRARAALT
jgi:hypothetical protein